MNKIGVPYEPGRNGPSTFICITYWDLRKEQEQSESRRCNREVSISLNKREPRPIINFQIRVRPDLYRFVPFQWRPEESRTDVNWRPGRSPRDRTSKLIFLKRDSCFAITSFPFLPLVVIGSIYLKTQGPLMRWGWAC